MNETMRIVTKSELNCGLAINYLIILYAFSLPLSKAATSLFGILLISLWLYEGNFKSKLDVLKGSLFIKTLYLLLTLSAVAVLWSPDITFWISFMWKYWHFLIIPVIYTSLLIENAKHVLTSFLAGMLVSEIVAFGIFFEIWSLNGIQPSNPSPFMDHVNYSIYLALTALILLNRIFFEPKNWLRFAYSGYFIMVTTNLFIIAGRTGQVAFIIGLVLIGIVNIRNKFLAIGTMLALGCIIMLSAYSYSTTFNQRVNQAADEVRRMVNEKDFSGSLSQRLSLWTMGTHVFIENPILGTGIGNETSGVKMYVEKYGFTPYMDIEENQYIDYHNAFVQYAAQLGILGLLLFVMIFISLYRLRFTSRLYSNINVAFIFLYLMLSMGGFSFHLMNSIVLFVLFSGLLSGISRIETTHSSNRHIPVTRADRNINSCHEYN